jgi:hypothetical protein
MTIALKMSLLCSEFEEIVWAHDKAFAVVHPIGPGVAVGEAAINQIPRSERRDRPCELLENGLNIHEGDGEKLCGTWQFSSFKQKKFLFSISEDSAKLYLPRTHSKINTRVMQNAN